MVSNCLFPTPIRTQRCFTYRAKPRFPDRWRLGSMLQAGAKRSSCQVAAAGRSCISRELCLAIWQPIEASEILQSGVIRRCRSNKSERRRKPDHAPLAKRPGSSSPTMSRDHFREASQASVVPTVTKVSGSMDRETYMWNVLRCLKVI